MINVEFQSSSPSVTSRIDRFALHRRIFRKGELENPRFWRRLGGAPDLEGKRVLDLGCGLGSLCLDAARRRAASVVGIDLDRDNLTFARLNLRENHADLASRVELVEQDVRTYTGEGFDYILSKDAFEHISDLRSVMGSLVRLLKPGGRMYIALGPLYESFYGDHGRLKAVLPWAHIVVPEEILLRRVQKLGVSAQTVEDLGLNKLRVHDYRKILRECGARVVLYKENNSEKLLARLLSPLQRLRALERYLTFNIYCILEK